MDSELEEAVEALDLLTVKLGEEELFLLLPDLLVDFGLFEF